MFLYHFIVLFAVFESIFGQLEEAFTQRTDVALRPFQRQKVLSKTFDPDCTKTKALLM
jgi:hypothetical protein